MSFTVRAARLGDETRLAELLRDIARLHSDGRPDIFKTTQKYSADECLEKIEQGKDPIFVAADGNGTVVGYIFCKVKRILDDPLFVDRVSVYIDDLCVDPEYRKHGIGGLLFDRVTEFAEEISASCIELNVWDFNGEAKRFYEKKGMTVQRSILELKLTDK